jgi:iron(III) transport system permease protein
MTLGLFPLIYLPVAAALRRADGTIYEVARNLGDGRFTAFRRVVLPQIRPALLGGCLLVTLALLAEFGAFEILRFQTFTTVIFTEFTLGFNAPAASALSLVLVLLSLAALGGEHVVGRRGPGRGEIIAAPRVLRVHRYRLGRARVPVLGGFAALTGLSVGIPVSTVIYWRLQPPDTTLPPIPLAGAAVNTLVYAGSAAILATVQPSPSRCCSSGTRRARHSLRAHRLPLPGPARPRTRPGPGLLRHHAAYPSTEPLLVITYMIMFPAGPGQPCALASSRPRPAWRKPPAHSARHHRTAPHRAPGAGIAASSPNSWPPWWS